MRAFVAVDLVPPTRLTERVPAVPSHFHVTLRFFDDLPGGRLAEGRQAMESVAAQEPPFVLGLRGIGTFPSRRDPRVVWVGFDRGRPDLERLAVRLEAALRGAGFPAEPRPFTAHATLFRVRGPRDRERAERLLDAEGDSEFGEQPVTALRLFESRRDRGGADHLLIAEALLRGPAPPIAPR